MAFYISGPKLLFETTKISTQQESNYIYLTGLRKKFESTEFETMRVNCIQLCINELSQCLHNRLLSNSPIYSVSPRITGSDRSSKEKVIPRKRRYYQVTFSKTISIFISIHRHRLNQLTKIILHTKQICSFQTENKYGLDWKSCMNFIPTTDVWKQQRSLSTSTHSTVTVFSNVYQCIL